MKLRCIWEHNADDSLIWCENLPGAYARGESLAAAEKKLLTEAESYAAWAEISDRAEDFEITEEKVSELNIADADSDVIFEQERKSLSMEEYLELKRLCLKSAADFLALYNAVPDKNVGCLPRRKSFYGDVPRTAEEMYVHTRSVNEYYFAELGVAADNEGSILECRERGFAALETMPDFLSKDAQEGSYGEWWSLRKLLRRFIWHDRIHAKAMYRMAIRCFGKDSVPNVFGFIEY